MDRSDYLWTLAAGLLLALAYPLALSSGNILEKYPHGITAIFGLSILFRTIKRTEPKRVAFLKGFTTGIVFYAAGLFWIIVAMIYFGNISGIGSTGILLVLVLYMALYMGLFTYLLSILTSRFPVTVVAPPLAVAIELLKDHGVTGYPWLNFGYSMVGIKQMSPLLQICDITGIYGLTFFVVMFAASLSLYRARDLKMRQPGVAGMIGTIVIMVGLIFYGFFRGQSIEKYLIDQPKEKISIVQGNIPQDQKWSSLRSKDIIAKYIKLSEEASSFNPSLIVWPEAAYPLSINFNETEIDSFKGENFKSRFLIGTISSGREGGKHNSYNSAFYVAPGGEILGRYDKMHLVAFSEQVIYEDYIPFIRNLIPPIAGDFRSGKDYRLFELKGKKFGTLICFESIFPWMARRFVRDGADFLVNITNDAWFGKTSGPYQHLDMATIRAIENRVFIIRAANTGISAVITPTGKVENKTALFEDAVINRELPLVKIGSIYTKIGNTFAYLCLAVTLIFLAMVVLQRQKSK